MNTAKVLNLVNETKIIENIIYPEIITISEFNDYKALHNALLADMRESINRLTNIIELQAADSDKKDKRINDLKIDKGILRQEINWLKSQSPKKKFIEIDYDENIKHSI